MADWQFDDDDYAYADGFYARRNLEAFNRAAHSDALREMQLAPAETLPLHGVKLSLWGYLAFGVMVFLIVGAGA